MSEILSLEIDSTPVERLTKALADLVAQGDKTDAGIKRVEQAQLRLNQAMAQAEVAAQDVGMNTNKATLAAQANAEATALQADKVQRLMDRYDPLGTKLRTLIAEQNMLSEAMGNSVRPDVMKSFQGLEDDIAKTTGLMDTAGVATAGAGLSMESLGLSSQRARMHLMMLGREAMSGDFSRMPNSLAGLAMHSNILSSALLPVIGVVVGIGAAVVTMAVAFAKGQGEALAMNNAMQITSGYAGETRGGMRDLALEMSHTGTVTIGVAKDIVTALVDSGRIGATSIGAVAGLASDFAAATGKDIAKIAPELEKLFADPAKGADELNKQMHFLSSAQLEHIAELERMGKLDEAQLELAIALRGHITAQIDQLGTFASAWDGVKKAASTAWDAMMGVGRPKTLNEELTAATAALDTAKANARAFPMFGNVGAAQSRVDTATYNVYSANEAAAANSAAASTQQAGIKADALVRQLATVTQVHAIELDIVNIEKNSTLGSVEKTEAIAKEREKIVNLQKDHTKAIADTDATYRNMLKTLQQMLLTDSERTEVAKVQAQLDALSPKVLKSITTERQAQLLALAAQVDVNKTLDNDAKNAAAMDKMREEGRKASADADQKDFDARQKIIKTMTDENDKIKEHNLEIGKTKEQVDILKAAEQDKAIVKAEAALADAQNDTSESLASVNKINQLQIELDKLRERKGLLLDSATLQAQADSAKAQGQAYDKLFNEVERQGKAAFVAVMGHGKDAFTAIGVALKTSVLDLLYELTVKKFIVNIAANVAQSAGIDLAGTSLGKASGISGSSLLSGASSVNSLFGGGFSTSAPAWYTAGIADGTIAAGTTAAVTSGVGAAGSAAGGWVSAEGGAAYAAAGEAGAVSGIAAAIPYIGWAVAAYSLLNAAGVFGGGNDRQASPQFTGLGGTVSRSGGFVGSVSTGMGSSPTDIWGGTQNSALPADALAAFNNSIAQVFTNADTIAKELGMDTSGLAAVTVKMGATSNGIQADMVAGINSTADAIAVALIPNLANLRLNGESLGQAFDRITIAAVQAKIAVAQVKQGWQDQLDVLTGARSQLQVDRTNQLATVTDAATIAIMNQVFAAQDLATASANAAVAVTSIATALGIASSAVDAQTSAAQSAATAAHTAADAYRQLNTTLMDAVTQLRGGALSPYNPAVKLAASGIDLNATYSQAMTGDATALGKLPQAATDFLNASRVMNASGAAYTSDFNKAADMLVNAQTVSLAQAAKQDSTATLLEQEVGVLGSIKTILASPSPDSQKLADANILLGELQKALTDPSYTIPKTLQDQITAAGVNSGSVTSGLAGVIAAVTSLVGVLRDQAAADAAAKAAAAAQAAAQAAAAKAAADAAAAQQAAADAAAKAAADAAAAKAVLQQNYTVALAAMNKAQDAMTSYTSGLGGGITRGTDLSLGSAAGQAQWNVNSRMTGGVWEDLLNKYWVTMWPAFAAYNALPSHALGLSTVPYDGYRASLHRDEAILTAPQATKWRLGESGITSADLAALREDVQRLTATVQVGDQANVRATQNIAQAQAAIAARQEAKAAFK